MTGEPLPSRWWGVPAWVGAGLFYAMLGIGALLCVTLTAFA